MLWLPASKLMIPSPMEVFPRLFKGDGFGSGTGGMSCGFSVGSAPKVSVNMTDPVGTPNLEAPTTSALTKMTLPNGNALPLIIGLLFGPNPET